MPTSYTPNLRTPQQAAGENPSTWGDIANTAFALLEQAIAGATSVVLTTGSTTLTANNGASDQSRCAIVLLSGALSGNCTIVVPSVSKSYIFYNNTTLAFTVTVQTSTFGGTATNVVLPQGAATFVFIDGATPNASVIAPSSAATTLGGVGASSFARLDAAQTNLYQSQNAWKEIAIAYSAGIALTLNSGNIFYTTLTGATTLNTPTGTPSAGYDQPFLYFITQDASGGRTVGFNSSWIFSSGIAPTVDQTPNATTVLSCVWSSTLGKVLVLQAYYGYNGTVVVGNLTITSNEVNVQVWRRMGSPSSAVNATVTVNPGVRVIASDPQSYAMDFSGFTSGSVITLIIGANAYILGRGGNGGMGGSEGHSGSTLTSFNSGNRGRAAGSAINGPGSGSTLNITNSGNIWGGGGGGGGGGTANPGASQDSNGGGGGGGAGGSIGGDGGNSGVTGANVQGNNGTDGTWVDSGANGTGGTGTGAVVGATGGNGGDWGAAGSAGANGGGGTSTAGGAGGAAGKAVNKNSATVNFNSGGTAPNVKGAVS